MSHTLPPIPDDMRAIYVEFKDGHSALYFKPCESPEAFNRIAMYLITEKMTREEMDTP